MNYTWPKSVLEAYETSEVDPRFGLESLEPSCDGNAYVEYSHFYRGDRDKALETFKELPDDEQYTWLATSSHIHYSLKYDRALYDLIERETYKNIERAARKVGKEITEVDYTYMDQTIKNAWRKKITQWVDPGQFASAGGEGYYAVYCYYADKKDSSVLPKWEDLSRDEQTRWHNVYTSAIGYAYHMDGDPSSPK